MPAYPENVRSPGQTGSRRGPIKPTRMTLSRQFARPAKLWSGCFSRPSGRYASGAAMVINAGEAILASAT